MRISNGALRLALITVSATVMVSACSSGSSSSTTAASAAPAAASAAPAAAAPASSASREAVNAPAEGYDAAIGSLAMFPTARNLVSWLPAQGQAVSLNNTTGALYYLIGCNFGCSASHDKFNLPNATGALAKLGKTPDNPGPLDWKILVENAEFPGEEGPRTAYPNQVFFTGAEGDRLGMANLKELGFTPLDLGAEVGPGIAAWQVPATWPTPINPIVGETRLFLTGTKLPTGWIPADGRVVPKQSKLGGVLSSGGFVLNGDVRAPFLGPVGNYSWAIAQEGEYPMFE